MKTHKKGINVYEENKNKNERIWVIRGFNKYPKGNFTFILNFNKTITYKFFSNARIIPTYKVNQLLLKLKNYLTWPKEK